nr:RHS repeat-associated core domain-containing protein [Bacteroidota bacterium]
ISGGDGLAAIYVKYDYAPDSMYYIMKDHLGSMVGAINEETGTIFRQSFDAWGRNRNPDNWTYTNIPDFPFDRGYTGHEHLKWFGLINMNGRMYDVALARFLSPDIFIQNSASTQSFNRYSYCINNPLNAIDPSGYDKLAFRGDYGSTSFEDPYRKEPSKSNMERILWRQQNAPGPTFDQWVENNTVTFYGENGTAFLNDHFNGLTIYEVNAFGKTTLACSFGELGDVIFGTDGGISFTSPTDGAYLPGIGINDQAGGGGIRNGLDIAGKTSYVAGMANIGAVILEKEYVRQATYNAKIAGQTGKVIPNYLRAISRTGKVLGGVGVLTTYGIAGYDVLNGNANTSTWVDVGATTLLFGAAILGGPIVAGGAVVGGVIYGGARLFYGDNVDSWINNNWGYNNQ